MQVWWALATREVALTAHALRALPPAPTTTSRRAVPALAWAALAMAGILAVFVPLSVLRYRRS